MSPLRNTEFFKKTVQVVSDKSAKTLTITGRGEMSYLEEIKAELKLLVEQKENNSIATEAAWKNAMTPLEDRLKKLLEEIPDSVKAEGLSLPVIQKMLKGRWRGNAHPGELGSALNKLGYQRFRCWRNSREGFKTVWKKSDIS